MAKESNPEGVSGEWLLSPHLRHPGLPRWSHLKKKKRGECQGTGDVASMNSDSQCTGESQAW